MSHPSSTVHLASPEHLTAPSRRRWTRARKCNEHRRVAGRREPPGRGAGAGGRDHAGPAGRGHGDGHGRLVVPVAWPAPDRALPKDGIEVVVTARSAGGSSGPVGPRRAGRRWWPTPLSPARSRSRARRAVDEALAGAWGEDRDGEALPGPAPDPTVGRGYAGGTSGRRTRFGPEPVNPDPVKESPWISTPCSVTMPMAC